MQFPFSHVLLVGAGGTGGYLAPAVFRYFSYLNPGYCPSFIIADGDDFEPHNAERQVMHSSVPNKADSLVSILSTQGIAARSYPSFITPNSLSSRALWGASPSAHNFCPLVILAVDNEATRAFSLSWFEQHLLSGRGGLWISPGNSSGLPFGESKGNVHWWGAHAGDGKSYGMDPRLVVPNWADPSDLAPTPGSCANSAPSQPQILAINLLAAAHTLSAITAILTDSIPNTISSLDFAPDLVHFS